jgi:signal transduction histidine kinase
MAEDRSKIWLMAPKLRYRSAVVLRTLNSGDLELELREPVLGTRQVRVPRQSLIDGTQVAASTCVNVFLERQSTTSGTWIGKLWEVSENPWLNGHLPVRGSLVEGKVVEVANDLTIFVELDRPSAPFALRARLNPDRLPGGSRKARSTLDRDDRIAAIVDRITEERLEIELDVQGAIDRLHNESEDANTRDKVFRRNISLASTNHKAQSIDRKPPEFSIGSGKHVAIYSGDRGLSESLGAWLERYGASVSIANKFKSFSAAAKKAKPTHVLIDANIADRDDVADHAKTTEARIAFLTASAEGGEVVIEQNYDVISKPFELLTVLDWLRLGKVVTGTRAKRIAGSEEASLWAGRRPTGQITEEGGEHLQRLCDRLKLTGAVWLRRDREQTYSLQTYTKKGINRDAIRNVEANLSRSAITGSGRDANEPSAPELTARPVYGPLPERDPVLALFDVGLRKKMHHCTFVIAEPNAKLRRVAFFAEREFDRPVRQALTDDYHHLRHLLQLFRLTEHMEAVEAFAAVGRVYAATLHELRNRLQEIRGLTQDVTRDIQSAKFEKAKAAAERLEHSVTGTLQLAEGDLAQVKKFRPEHLDVNHVTEQVVRRMRSFRAAKYGYSDTQVEMIADPRLSGLTISLSPLVIEQPLVNIIDNALYHIGDHPWGRIEVETRLTGDADTPIQILVRDNGGGITAAERAAVFEPRETTKGSVGTGMGLYTSRNLLNACGGELECIDSVRWVGTTMRIRLPVILNSSAIEAKSS